MPDKIIVRKARVHNLKDIDVEIPLNRINAVCGLSGSGKSSLALGVLYAEGSRRYLESLSTYTRRRMTQAQKAFVDEVLYIPAALALRQRPAVPGIRSTFGTSSELLNSLRLMFSRLASHACPNGHYHEPTLDVAAGKELVCPVCGERFFAPGAEDLAFNSTGACSFCDGTGIVRAVDESTLVPDESLTIEQGAVAPWNSLMWSLMVDVCREMGVRTDIPFSELSAQEREIVFHGKPEKKHIIYKAKNSNQAAELDFTYYNAVYTVQNALSKVKDESGMKRVEKFLREDVCPHCHGSRLNEAARRPIVMSKHLDEVCTMPLSSLAAWVRGVPESLPDKMRPMAESIAESFLDNAARLMDLGLSYLSLDRASSTLSTGERQRVQLARCVRNRTTGVLYVLDEPSIGMHPANIEALKRVMKELVADGNTIVLVDHDARILSCADYMIEMGPGSGKNGGFVTAAGSVEEIKANPASLIGPFLTGQAQAPVRSLLDAGRLFSRGKITLETGSIHTVRPLELAVPKGCLTVVTGVSGSGKTTLILESLVPALEAMASGKKLPSHVKSLSAEGIKAVKLIDASPIGINIRSTVATYSGVHDELRKLFARQKEARDAGYRAGDFSCNTGSLRCPVCDGTGQISLDVQFLPDVDIPCPECRGSRYGRDARKVHYNGFSLPEIMAMDISDVIPLFSEKSALRGKLETLAQLGLGYLTLGQETPGLSGGEAQRLKLAGEMSRRQSDTVFVFDEPSIGLHPLDVRSLLSVFQGLIDNGATVIAIEHDEDVIRNADYVVDMGPGGGEEGGRIIYQGPLSGLKDCRESLTGKYLFRS